MVPSAVRNCCGTEKAGKKKKKTKHHLSVLRQGCEQVGALDLKAEGTDRDPGHFWRCQSRPLWLSSRGIRTEPRCSLYVKKEKKRVKKKKQKNKKTPRQSLRWCRVPLRRGQRRDGRGGAGPGRARVGRRRRRRAWGKGRRGRAGRAPCPAGQRGEGWVGGWGARGEGGRGAGAGGASLRAAGAPACSRCYPDAFLGER